MLFNKHSGYEGKHAFLSPSTYHWVNYDDEKLESRYRSMSAARRGSDIHDLAHNAIKLGIRFAESNQSLSTYVNDAIGYKMASEQMLFYSNNCFGTADSISFRGGILRIHDLKTGLTPTKEKQLEVYAAIFCLEYEISPFEIEIELRIYQRDDEPRVFHPSAEGIHAIMETIVYFDKQIEAMRSSDHF